MGSRKLYPRRPSSAVRLVRPRCVSATAVEGSVAETPVPHSLTNSLKYVGIQYALQKFAPLLVYVT